MNKEEFNIFSVLSVADKELVHSSIIKLIIELDTDFLQIFEVKDVLTIKTEVSKKTKDNKHIRFDIVGFLETDTQQHNIVFFIENKFKATPTVDQLELYDKYFREQHHSPTKVLMVYFSEQVPSDVQAYCEGNNWHIYPYFSTKNDKSFFKYLVDHSINISKNEKIIFLIKEYIQYLERSWAVLFEIIQSPDLFTCEMINKYENINDRKRDIWFRYMLHLQSLISKKIKINYNSTNDGGTRHIPSIAFWFYNNSYFSIDGEIVKLGFVYNKQNKTKLDNLRAKLANNKDIAKGIIVENIEYKVNQGESKDKSEDERYSVIYLLSFNLKSYNNKEAFVESMGRIINRYYNFINSIS